MGALIMLLMAAIWVCWMGGLLADRLSGAQGRRDRTTPSPFRQEELSAGFDLPMLNGMVAGTIEALDPISLSFVLHSDSGRLSYMVVPDSGALAGLAHGDRVWLEADENGALVTIHKWPAAAPETEPAGFGGRRGRTGRAWDGPDGREWAPVPRLAAVHPLHGESERLAG
jgi:hypothetical protein